MDWDNNVELTIGRRVRLVSEEYFPGPDSDTPHNKDYPEGQSTVIDGH